MNADAKYPTNLPNKPLVEVIFELRWVLKNVGGPNGTQVDPGFRFLLGRYQQRIEETYPTTIELPAASLPEDMAPYIVRHQFRTAPNAWPCTQLGPGILTVNETDGYTWAKFEPRVLEAAIAVFEAYPKKTDPPFTPASVILRYQNAMTYDPSNISPLEFVNSKLHTTLAIDNNLFEAPGGVEQPAAVGINALFPLTELPGHASLQIKSGAKNNLPAIILDIAIRSTGEATPTDESTLDRWLTSAHTIAEKWFFTLCRDELLTEFNEEEK